MRLAQTTYVAIEAWLTRPVDARVYALVRVAYAVLSLALLLDLWPDRSAFVSDQGVAMASGRLALSAFAWHQTPAFVTAAMLIALAAALSLLCGVWQRASALLLFVWHVSVSDAAYMVSGGFDAVARLVAFVVLVSPMPRVWCLRADASAPIEVSRYGLRLLQWQTFILYWATVWLKAPDPFWRSGEFMAYFWMSMYSAFATPAFADYPALSVLATWSALAAEVALPLLLWKSATRRLGFALGLALHGAIALTSTLGLFSLAMLPLYFAFLEGGDIDDAVASFRRWGAPRTKPAESVRPKQTARES